MSQGQGKDRFIEVRKTSKETLCVPQAASIETEKEEDHVSDTSVGN